MEFDNNTVDIISIIIILISILLSYSRGLIRECFTVLAWILSLFSSMQLGPLLLPIIFEVPFLKEFLLGNCPLAMLLSYVITFVISLTLFSIIIHFLNISKLHYESVSLLSGLDKIGGILFGFIKSLIILMLLLICIKDLLPNFIFKTVINDSIDKSISYYFLQPSKVYVSKIISEKGTVWVNDTYDIILKNECKKNNLE